MRLLLLSNSTNYGQKYFEYSKDAIKDFLKQINHIVFVPYAAVNFSYDEYENKVNQAFQDIELKVTGIQRYSEPLRAINEAEAILVGGGNTFKLLKMLYHYHLVEAIRNKVIGGIPYVGWSAGSNVCCPTIKTTNDMPVVEPPSFKGLELVPFQINPHFTDATIPNHGGETRSQRIEEFVSENPSIYVVGLSEGTMLKLEDEHLSLLGNHPVKIFRKMEPVKTLNASENLQFLLKH
ncbi:MAG: dipeptidase PepE [Candidatus Cyclobacteriaceae bacterium M3_2C_046]